MGILRIEKLHIHDFRCFKDITIKLGKVITVIAGHNATGKSTILGLLGHCAELKMKDGKPLLWKQFRTEFSEIIKASKDFDKIRQNVYTIYLSDDTGAKIEPVSFRTTWQKYKNKDRFRIIPMKTQTRQTEKKIEWPTFYLGLSRLYPIGELEEAYLTDTKLTSAQKDRFFRAYKHILSMNEDPVDCAEIKIPETTRKATVGVKTTKYDPMCNSAGQDNLSQILLAVMSFESLKDQHPTDWNGGMLLIDELDATLHPAAQNKLVEYLYKRAKDLQIQIVFTTHSLSMLDFICNKCSFNQFELVNDYEINYLTTRNGFLQLIVSPSYETIYQDMLITTDFLTNDLRKIAVWTEDYESRWFFEKIIGKNCSRVNILNVSMGHDELLKLIQQDYDYFKNFLFILDGDVSQEKLDTVAKRLGLKRLPNVLKLPGDTFPEKVMFNYLSTLSGTHDIFKELAATGFSLRVLNERGPDSYSYDKERERYKKWFKDFETVINEAFSYWKRDFITEVDKFVKEFNDAFNQIAARINLPRLK
ncbi:MAG: ATP-binding protein [Firmicutes bacterium]|nr:ATP-binding protein [Bacillota bacterium]